MDPAQFKAKINKIRTSFRSAKDLHTYLSEVRKCLIFIPEPLPVGLLMPPLKSCRLEFLQAILTGKKLVIKQEKCKGRHVPNWPELAMKLIYPVIVAELPAIKQYLPDPQGDKEKRLPDRHFFYQVLYALHPEQTEDLVSKAIEARKPKEQAKLAEAQSEVNISQEWMENLLRYDFASSKCLATRLSYL